MHRAEANSIGRHGHTEEFLWRSDEQQRPGNDEWHPVAGRIHQIASHSDRHHSATGHPERNWQCPERGNANGDNELVAVQEAIAESSTPSNEPTAEWWTCTTLIRGNAETSTEYQYGGVEPGNGQLGGANEGLECDHGE